MKEHAPPGHPRSLRHPACTSPPLPGRQHCETHHERRRETWRAGRKDYRDRQKARTDHLTRWAGLLRDTILPAAQHAYDQNDLAMDAYERLQIAILHADRNSIERELDELADALENARHPLAASNNQIIGVEQFTRLLAHLIEPPPRPRESRNARPAPPAKNNSPSEQKSVLELLCRGRLIESR